MKKILLQALTMFVCTSGYAQTYSTGLLPLSATSGGTSLEYSAKVDVTSNQVTLTLIGSATRWLGIGFGTNSMSAGGDVVIFDGTNLTDRTFQGIGSTPVLDANQDWTVISNTVDNGVRTVIGTRALSTSDSSDYVFSASANTLSLVYARGFSLNLGYHGSDGYGFTTSNLTLNTLDFEKPTTKIYPNPASDSFVLQCDVVPTKIDIYTHSGQLVKTIQPDSTLLHLIQIADLKTGIYMVEVISSAKKSWTKVIVK